jgi:hypothetical protein
MFIKNKKMKKAEKIVSVTEDDLIKAQNDLIDSLQIGIALREQIIDTQRALIKILREDLQTKRQWWKFWK